MIYSELHSLTDAICDGILSEEAVYCGLTPRNILDLSDAGFGNRALLVKLRSAEADGWTKMTVEEVLAWSTLPERTVNSFGIKFTYNDIRSIYPVLQ